MKIAVLVKQIPSPAPDRGWLPRSRQVGVTGRAIAPRLYVAIGVSASLPELSSAGLTPVGRTEGQVGR